MKREEKKHRASTSLLLLRPSSYLRSSVFIPADSSSRLFLIPCIPANPPSAGSTLPVPVVGLPPVEPAEDHPPRRGLQDARHRQVDLLADGVPAALDDDHGPVGQV